MSAQILTLLKFGLLALLYLFFARVLFSVWSELRPTGKHSSVAIPVSAAAGAAGTAHLGGQRAAAPTNERRANGRASRDDRATGRRGRRAKSQKSRAKGERRRNGHARSAVPAIGELLIVEPEAIAGFAYPLGDEITVGRALGCGVPIDDTFVSSVHARVFARGAGSYVIEDLGSTNGTWLNDSRIDGPTAMAVGDRLRFGATLLELR